MLEIIKQNSQQQQASSRLLNKNYFCMCYNRYLYWLPGYGKPNMVKISISAADILPIDYWYTSDHDITIINIEEKFSNVILAAQYYRL